MVIPLLPYFNSDIKRGTHVPRPHPIRGKWVGSGDETIHTFDMAVWAGRSRLACAVVFPQSGN